MQSSSQILTTNKPTPSSLQIRCPAYSVKALNANKTSFGKEYTWSNLGNVVRPGNGSRTVDRYKTKPNNSSISSICSDTRTSCRWSAATICPAPLLPLWASKGLAPPSRPRLQTAT